MRPRKQGESGQRIEFPAPISISNLMLVCPKCNKPTRVSYKYLEVKKTTETGSKAEDNLKNKQVKKKKYRVCGKCKQTID